MIPENSAANSQSAHAHQAMNLAINNRINQPKLVKNQDSLIERLTRIAGETLTDNMIFEGKCVFNYGYVFYLDNTKTYKIIIDPYSDDPQQLDYIPQKSGWYFGEKENWKSGQYITVFLRSIDEPLNHGELHLPLNTITQNKRSFKAKLYEFNEINSL